MPPKTAPPASGSPRRYAGYAVLSLLFAFVQLRMIALLLPKAFQLSARVGAGVAAGEPDWRVFQNRVLGPYLVEAFGALGLGPVDAYAAFTLLALFLAGFAALALTDRLRDPQRPPLAAFLLLHACLAVVLPCIWLFPWDLLSLPLFVGFNYWVLRGARVRSLVALYAVAILNHETAVFMAAWLIVDPWVRWRAARGGARFDRSRAWLGVALVAAGLAVIEVLRRVLMVHEMLRPENLPPLSVYGRSFHWALLENGATLARSFTLDFPAAYPFVVPAFVLGVAWLAVRLARRDPARCAALCAVTGAMIVALACFGLVFETRVLMPLVPFVVMNGWPALRGEAG